MESTATPEGRASTGLLDDLLERRVPQYLAIYVGASWGLIEFSAFLEDRYLLSPHWTNLLLLLLAALLPSVVLFTYFHGRRGADRWRTVEKVFIPANVIAAAVALFMVFGGKDLGAVTTTITTEDEQGNDVERVVPKSEFRKRLALFPLSTPTDSAWLGEAVAGGLATDLFQDMFLDLRIPQQFTAQVREAGMTDASGLPRGLKRQIARDMNLGYFLDGEVARTGDDGYRVETVLHDVDGGDIVARHEFAGPDLLTLLDSASLRIRRDLDLPDRHIAESADVAVSEMTTESMAALEEFYRGIHASTWNADFAETRRRLERAVALDPTYAEAWLGLYQTRLVLGDGAGAQEALQRAMDHSYRLTERAQFIVKGELYAMRQEFDKYFAVHEMRADLYPQDIQAQLLVAQNRTMQDNLDGAIDALERALSLDPTQSELLHRIGSLHQQLGQIDPARDYLGRYAEAVPDRPEPYMALGELEVLASNHAAAREHYEHAALIDPGNVDVLVELAQLEQYLGEWSAAESRGDEAIAAARSPEGRERALNAARSYSRYRADYDRALELQEQAHTAAEEWRPPLIVLQLRVLGLAEYVRAGHPEQARDRLEALAARIPAPANAVLVPIGRAQIWAELENADSLAAAVTAAEDAIRETGLEALTPNVVYLRGRLHELRGEWREALAAYQRERELNPSDASIPAQIGRVYRQLGDLERAERSILQTLSVWPSHGQSNYELGRVYLDRDRPGEAIRYLEQALDTWALAAPDHDMATDARQQLDLARSRLRAITPAG